jgi:hypothetical protein
MTKLSDGGFRTESLIPQIESIDPMLLLKHLNLFYYLIELAEIMPAAENQGCAAEVAVERAAPPNHDTSEAGPLHILTHAH